MTAARMLFSAIMFAGCTVGPDFAGVTTQHPADYSGRPREIETPPHAKEIERQLAVWWESFNDPVLSQLVTGALRANLDVRRARSRVLQARALRRGTAAGLYPQFDTKANYRRSGTNADESTRFSDAEGGEVSRDSTTRNFYTAGVDASWEIDFFGGLRRSVEAAEARAVSAEEELRAVFLTVAGEVSLEYLELRGFQERLRVARENARTQEATLEITRRRFLCGFASALDSANAAAQLQFTLAELPALHASEERSLQNLAVLLGRAPGELDGTVTAYAPLPSLPDTIYLDLPSDMVRRRPDIRRAEALVHAATAEIGVATADLFPKFSITGSFGAEGSSLSSVLDGDTRLWAFGPGISWPLFNAGRIRANIAVQNELQEQALLDYRSAVLSALKDVESSLSGFRSSIERRTALELAERESAKALALSRELYSAGMTEFLSVLTAERSLFAAQDAVVRERQSVLSSLVSLYKALGGGITDG